MGGIVVLVFLVFAFVLLFSAIKIVPQGREFTVERFGRYTRTLKPGITILTPFLETVGRKVNMMEQVLDVPQQEVITKDNVSVKVDAIVFIQVMDAAAAAYRVDNLMYAITQLAQTNLRTVVGAMELDDEVTQRTLGKAVKHLDGDALLAITRGAAGVGGPRDPWGPRAGPRAGPRSGRCQGSRGPSDSQARCCGGGYGSSFTATISRRAQLRGRRAQRNLRVPRVPSETKPSCRW